MTGELLISDGVIRDKQAETGVPERRIRSALVALKRECIDMLWPARQGGTETAYMVYDANDRIVMGFPSPEAWPTAPTLDADVLEAAHECHRQQVAFWAHDAGVRGHPTPGDDALWVTFEPTPDDTWRRHVMASLQWYEPIEYEVHFAYPKWNDYDASVYGAVEIPGEQGTVRKAYKLQGFPTHRTPEDGVWETTTVEHVETGVTFRSESDEFQIPTARSFDTFPFLPHLQRAVYRQLFEDESPDYRDLVESEFTLCSRCGTYERDGADITVSKFPLPESPQSRDVVCSACYARSLRDAFGVTDRVASMFAEREAGLTYDRIAKRHGVSPDYARRMADQVAEYLWGDATEAATA